MLKLANIFNDGMVLQRDLPIKVWGSAGAGQKVTVALGDSRGETTADAGGKWRLSLPAKPAGGPYELRAESGGDQAVFKDVLLGDVWLLSGQSNMAVSLLFAQDDFQKEIKGGANYPAIRQFTIPMAMNFREPMEEFPATMDFPFLPPADAGEDAPPMPPFPPAAVWHAATPDKLGFFSAVGYFFAKKIHEKYQVPIGLINTAVGGVPVEAFMSRDALADYPLDLAEADHWADDDRVKQIPLEDAARLKAWNEGLDRRDPGVLEGWHESGYNDSGWKTAGLCDDWDTHPDMPSCGSVWFRRVLDIPPELAGKPARLSLGMLVEGDRCYVNGKLVGRADTRWFNRDYPIRAGLKAGRNVIVIRLLSQRRVGRAVPGCRLETTQRLVWPDMPEKNIALDRGDWKYRPGAEADFLEESTTVFYKPTGLYNGMIAPLHNYAIKGALWYQGESNTDRPNTYADHFCKMIEDWRKKWAVGDFSIFWVQLPNFAPLEKRAVNWAYLREEQRRCLRLANSGMAAAIDAGETWDIHPPRKAVLGERLALSALRVTYGENMVHSGPVFREITVTGKDAVLRFDSVGTGLASRDGGPLGGFAVFDGQKQYPAAAEIRGDTVAVSCPRAERIVAVRYAWESDPLEANLINKEGLPAPPFDSRLSR
jgi:sialate O-acetylesterase